jgi:low temperature requirement protein LtrA
MLAAAAAIPAAFDDGSSGLTFAAPYVAVRLIGLGLYWVGLKGDREHQAALRTYVPVQLVSPLLVLIGGALDDPWRVGFWTVAILVDVASVAAAGRGDFRVDPAHFAERHGLIVIIALGESVIAIGATATELGITRDVGLLVAVAFVAVAGLWWCYFDWVHAAAEARLAGEPDHRRRAHLARDLYTLGHLPIAAGIVVFATAIEEALLHPTEGLDTFGIAALAVGPSLYLAGFVAGNLRATGHLLVTRTLGLVGVLVTGIVGGNALSALAAVALVAAVIVAVAAIESNTHPGAPHPLDPLNTPPAEA